MTKSLVPLLLLSIAVPVAGQQRTRYLLSMRGPAALSELRLARESDQFSSHDVRTFRNVDALAADLTEAEAAALRHSPSVKSLAPVVSRSLDPGSEPSWRPERKTADSRYTNAQTVDYGIDLVHGRDVWPFTRGNDHVHVAVLDTGIDYSHPDLIARYQGGYNAFSRTDDPKDDHGHGTHVSGIIGASDNNFGVVGVAPEAKIWAVKVLSATGQGSDETVMAGMDWVISKKREIGGNWIVNLSLGSATASDPERAMFARAIDENILVIAAAGNRSSRGIDYPGGYDRVVAVSAIDNQSAMADFSSFGRGVALAGPGVNVLSTFRIGAVRVAAIDAGPASLETALPLNGSSLGEVTAPTVYCGLGKPEQFPSSTAGKVALITRGELQFRQKVRNALLAGALAVVIIPPVDDRARAGWTLLVDDGDASFSWPVVVSVSAGDGEELIRDAGQSVTVSYSPADYVRLSGTSMATPHATGSAALVWSLAPDASAEQIRLAMKLSAFDLGASGYDELYGYGRIDALASAKYVAPALFGLPPTPTPVSVRRRAASPHR